MKQFSFFKIMFLLTCTLGFNACVDREFDSPPVFEEDTDLVGNFTIAELKALHTTGKLEPITGDKVLEVYVSADDRSGNYFKTLVVQDATGGIDLKLNGVELFNDYPVGKKLIIKLDGLYLGDYNKLIQLGGSIGVDGSGKPRLNGIEDILVKTYILKKKGSVLVSPAIKTIGTLGVADQSTLIQLDNVEFDASELGQTFADAVGKVSVNRTLRDCSGNSILVRTSGYANFAGQKLPEGKGTLIAIYSVFGTDKQLILRDPSDLIMTGTRCNGGGGSGSVTEDFNGVSNNVNISLGGWKNYAEKGTRLWQGKVFQGNGYAQATAFGSTDTENVSWLITPAINLAVPQSISFETALQVWKHNGLEVLISTNFDGTNVASATWTSLSAVLAGSATGDNIWVPSGSLDLSGYSGTAHIAFKYNGDKTTNTTSYRIDNVLLKNN